MTFTAQPSPAMPGTASFNTSPAGETGASKYSAITPAFEDVTLTPFAPPVEIKSDAPFYQSAGAPNPFEVAEPVPGSFLEPVVPSPVVVPEVAIAATAATTELASEPHVVSRPERNSSNPVSQWIRTIGVAFESLGKRLVKTTDIKSEPKPLPEPVISQSVHSDEALAFDAQDLPEPVLPAPSETKAAGGFQSSSSSSVASDESEASAESPSAGSIVISLAQVYG